MSTVVPINQQEIIGFLFENAEKIPNNIYINFMDLIKKYYENGLNLNEMQTYLDQNKQNMETFIFDKIHTFLKNEKKVKPNFNFNFNFSLPYIMFYAVLLIGVSSIFGLIVLAIISKNAKNASAYNTNNSTNNFTTKV